MEITNKDMKVIIASAHAFGQAKDIGRYALASAVNEVAAEGAKEFCAQVHILIPTYAFKSRIHTMEKMMRNLCKERNVELAEIRSERSAVITQTMAQVTVAGKMPVTGKMQIEDEIACSSESVKPAYAGKDVVLTKYIGMEGMVRVASEQEEKLKERFSDGFVKQILSYKDKVFAVKEIASALENGAVLIRQASEGGILAALWNLAKETECGIDADLKQLSILQETVEVCEYFKLNPYQLASAGCMLMVHDDGEQLVSALQEQGIKAVVVGKLTDNNDKILRNGEEIRYIDRPAPDELNSIL